MKIIPHRSGRMLEGRTPYGSWSIALSAEASGVPCRVVDAAGREVGTVAFDLAEPAVVEASLPPDPARRAQPVLGPGTWLSMLIQVVTVGRVRPCAACRGRAARLDRLGWRGLVAWPWRRVRKAVA